MSGILGLDLGTKRVGVAVSDESRSIASALTTFIFTGRRSLLKDVSRLAREYAVSTIVVGLPVTLAGKVELAASHVMAHVEWFRSHSAFEWILHEERLTTKEAQRILDETELTRSKKREIIDRLAAQRILQGYLDFKRAQSGPL